MMSILTDISENLQHGKAKVVKELVQQAIDEGRCGSRTTRSSCLRSWWRPAP